MHKDGSTPICADVGDEGEQYLGARWVVPDGQFFCEPPVEFHLDGTAVCSVRDARVLGPKPPPGYDACVPPVAYMHAGVQDQIPLLNEDEYVQRLQAAVAAADWGAASVARLELAALSPDHPQACDSVALIRSELAKAAGEEREKRRVQREEDAQARANWVERQRELQAMEDPLEGLLRRGAKIEVRGNAATVT